MKASLIAQNIAGAIPYFASAAADQYRGAFQSIGATELSVTMSAVPALTLVFLETDSAQYRFDQVIDGITITFPVDFVKENGVWKILEY